MFRNALGQSASDESQDHSSESKALKSGSGSSSGSGHPTQESGPQKSTDRDLSQSGKGSGKSAFPTGDSSSSGTMEPHKPSSRGLQAQSSQDSGGARSSGHRPAGAGSSSSGDVPSGAAAAASGRTSESTSSDFNFNGVPGLDGVSLSCGSNRGTSTEQQSEIGEKEEGGQRAVCLTLG